MRTHVRDIGMLMMDTKSKLFCTIRGMIRRRLTIVKVHRINIMGTDFDYRSRAIQMIRGWRSQQKFSDQTSTEI